MEMPRVPVVDTTPIESTCASFVPFPSSEKNSFVSKNMNNNKEGEERILASHVSRSILSRSAA